MDSQNLFAPQQQQQYQRPQQQQQQKYYNIRQNNGGNAKHGGFQHNNSNSAPMQKYQQPHNNHYYPPHQQFNHGYQNSNVDYNNNNNNNNNNHYGDSSVLREKLLKLNINVDSSNRSTHGRLLKTPTTPNVTSPGFGEAKSPLTPTFIKPDQPIWKSFIYDPNTSIYLIKREKIDTRFLMNKQYLNDIALKTKTNINFYANGDIKENSTTIYFTVNGVYEARCDALEMLRDETGKAGVIVNLPSLLTNDDTNRRSQLKSNLNRQISSPAAATVVKKHCTFALDDINSDKKYNADGTQQPKYAPNGASNSFKRTKSFHNKFELDEQTDNNNNINNTSPLNRTSSQSSSIISSTSSTSSSSSMSTFSNNLSFKPQQQLKPGAKKRYTTEFLLQRADAEESKKIPKDWPELNLRYPNICFCGRVISYFNPHKYQQYWMKLKQLNQHLHV